MLEKLEAFDIKNSPAIFERNMNDVNDSIDPVKFIESITYDKNNNKHIVLFYEQPEDAKRIQYQFIKNGLEDGISSVYAIAGDGKEVIESELESFGVDVKKYKNKDLLHVLSIHSLTNYECKRPTEIIQQFIDKNLSHVKPPYNIVSRLFEEIKTKAELSCIMEVERDFDKHFHNFQGNVLCTYPVKAIDPETYGEWVYVLLQNHNASIILTDSSRNGIAINMR